MSPSIPYHQSERQSDATANTIQTVLSHRYALEDVTLPDNTFIPKGTMIATNMSRMWDQKYYSNPNEWQPDRYLKQPQEPGKENSAQFMTTTLESLGFGLGTHACPGRFFASTNLKIMLAYVLDNYEFERVDDGSMLAKPSLAEGKRSGRMQLVAACSGVTT